MTGTLHQHWKMLTTCVMTKSSCQQLDIIRIVIAGLLSSRSRINPLVGQPKLRSLLLLRILLLSLSLPLSILSPLGGRLLVYFLVTTTAFRTALALAGVSSRTSHVFCMQKCQQNAIR